ncbi:MAG: indole-3-glycerol phosphate synthase TrpC [Candidatus Omnitrophica bacterium]|nr:indole-3-glycerol phosphate synthase TrpC [Candidatus Omnitrophota bacterium]
MILDEIVRHKKQEIDSLKKRQPLSVLRKAAARFPKKAPVFLEALKARRATAVIAEMKRRSPSKGLLRRDFNPVLIAQSYARAGASALSVLTDERFFGGSTGDLEAVRRVVNRPILRKDFILDEIQVYESKLIGADAILLIAAILSLSQLKKLSRLAQGLGLDALLEIHSEADLKKILPLKAPWVGINNRDLETFRVDIQTTARLAGKLPRGTFVVSESGIQNHGDFVYLSRRGADAVLVGESLMRERDCGEALLRLLGKV